MVEISTIGLDIAKNVFQIHGVDGVGNVTVRRQLRRSGMTPVFCTCSGGKRLETSGVS